jgi:hypothetical protein
VTPVVCYAYFSFDHRVGEVGSVGVTEGRNVSVEHSLRRVELGVFVDPEVEQWRMEDE